ncbi:MAG TPA: hypothetical protein VI935_02900 [Thermodesulfobacteriota bacterium]|nr:hypothetical protein [Thermodesulfobacteriota bacterium]
MPIKAGMVDEMDEYKNILSRLLRTENHVTEFLCGLCVYKPFREILVRLFTGGQYGSDDISLDDIDTQTTIEGSIPDLSMLGEKVNILVEVKIDSWRELTQNQPETYLRWLASSNAESRFFIALIPPVYDYLEELESRINSFHRTNKRNPVNTSIIRWDDLLQKISKDELDQMSPYIKDFSNLLKSRYEVPIIKFTFEEMQSMYDPNSAKGIEKLLKLIEEVLTGLEKKGYQVSHAFNRRWWDDGEYGGYVLFHGQEVLWFGLWQEYWENKGVPLSFGIHFEKWDNRLRSEFKRLHPSSVIFPQGGPNRFLIEKIDRDVFLSDDPGKKILEILEKDLTSLCKQIREKGDQNKNPMK